MILSASKNSQSLSICLWTKGISDQQQKHKSQVKSEATRRKFKEESKNLKFNLECRIVELNWKFNLVGLTSKALGTTSDLGETRNLDQDL